MSNGDQKKSIYQDTTLGYLVPEFPAQTHIFFWREIRVLQQLGYNVRFISTKRPHPKTVSHSWATEVISQTSYLHPIKLADMRVSSTRLREPRHYKKKAIEIYQYVSRYSGEHTLIVLTRLVTLLPYAIRLLTIARVQGWQHVHVGSCGRSAMIAWLASVLGDITYSLSMLGPDFATYGGDQKLKWSRASFGLFQSHQLLEEGRHLLAECLPSNIRIAPVGVNPAQMQRRKTYTSWKPGETCRLYCCARLNPIKGHVHVICALALIRKRGIDAILVIAGEDELGGKGYRRFLESFVAEQNLEDYVEFVGAVSEEKNRSYLEDAHIYLMGSLKEAAGAVATMEAMSMELPVIMTRVGATEELIDSEKDGLLVEKECAQALANAVLKLLFDPDFALAMGKAARTKILHSYSDRVSAEAIAFFLNQMKSPEVG